MLRMVGTGLILALTACTASGYSQKLAPPDAKAQTAIALTRMLPRDRLRAIRPRDLPSGTRIYYPEVVEIDTPGNHYILGKSAVVSSTPAELIVRLDDKLLHFKRSTSTITIRSGAQEVRVPPGIHANADLGTPAEIIP